MKKLSLILLAITCVITSLLAQVTSNSPICGNENLIFSINQTGKKYLVKDPNGTETAYNSKPITIAGTSAFSGTYTISIISNADDTTMANVEVLVTQLPSRPTVSGKTEYCEGETLDLTANSSNNPDTYKWVFNDGTTFTQNPLNITATKGLGTTVKVSAIKNSCESTQNTVTLTVTPLPTIRPSLSGLKNPYCSGDPINLTITNAGTFDVSWLFPDNSVQNIKKLSGQADVAYNGQHTIAFEKNSCRGPELMINILVDEVPNKPTVISSTSSICTGDTLRIYSPDDASFTRKWILPSGATTSVDSIINYNVQNRDSGLYILSLINGTCASDTVGIRLQTKQTPILLDFYTNAPICEQDTFKFFTKWQFGGTSVIRDTLGRQTSNDTLIIPNMPSTENYYLLINNDNGCKTKVDTIITPVIEKIRSGPVATNSPVCKGEVLQLLATEHDSAIYIWKGPKGFSDTTLQVNIVDSKIENSGLYTVRYENMCDTITTKINVTVNPVPVFNIVGDSSVCEDDLTLATFGVSPEFTNYTWNTGEVTQEITVAKNNYYQVLVENEFGCTTLKGKDIPTKCFPRFYTPNAFTPNGDGLNDIFYLYNHNLEVAEFTIFNHLGQVVFNTRDLSIGWDGTYEGYPAKTGKYVYKIEYDTIFRGVVTSKIQRSYFFLIR